MTAELHDQEAPDAEEFTVCWLTPLLRASAERDTDDVLPFALVQQITGTDDPDCGESTDVIQIDILGNGPQAASIAKREVHRRMLYLAENLVDIVMSDGSKANADYVETVMKPVRMAFADDTIVRYVARYRLGLSHVAV